MRKLLHAMGHHVVNRWVIVTGTTAAILLGGWILWFHNDYGVAENSTRQSVYDDLRDLVHSSAGLPSDGDIEPRKLLDTPDPEYLVDWALATDYPGADDASFIQQVGLDGEYEEPRPAWLTGTIEIIEESDADLDTAD